jgi:hypothetical protein
MRMDEQQPMLRIFLRFNTKGLFDHGFFDLVREKKELVDTSQMTRVI